MATNLQSYNTGSGVNQLTAEQAEFYQRVMLKSLYDQVAFMPYGVKKNIPKNAGATTSWRRLEMPQVSTTAIVEGTTPEAIDLTINKITATVQQFGAWVKISDLIDLVGLDPILTETSKMLGEHAGLSMDIVIRDIIKSGTNKQFAGGRANRGALTAGDKITAAEIQKARATMVKNNVKPIKLPNGKQGYLAFVHPDTVTQLFNLTEWKDMNTYVDTSNQEAGVIGQMYGIYFKEVTTAPTFTDGGAGGTLAGKQIIIIGDGAFGIPDVGGSSKPEIIVHSDGSTENPMNLYKTVAWKSCFTAARLNEKCIIDLEVLDA